MTAYYAIQVHVGKGNGDHGSEWSQATAGNMSKSAAMGLLTQFAKQYHARLFRGFNVGKLVAEKSPAAPAVTPLFEVRYLDRLSGRTETHIELTAADIARLESTDLPAHAGRGKRFDRQGEPVKMAYSLESRAAAAEVCGTF